MLSLRTHTMSWACLVLNMDESTLGMGVSYRPFVCQDVPVRNCKRCVPAPICRARCELVACTVETPIRTWHRVHRRLCSHERTVAPASATGGMPKAEQCPARMEMGRRRICTCQRWGIYRRCGSFDFSTDGHLLGRRHALWKLTSGLTTESHSRYQPA